MPSQSVFRKTLVRHPSVRSFEIVLAADAGWQICERRDGHTVQQHVADWHRVERDLARFAREIENLRRDGWQDA